MTIYYFFVNIIILISCLYEWSLFFLFSRSAKQVQQKLLKNILSTNTKTIYGQKYNFSKIKSYKEFTMLPLTEYQDYFEYISKIRQGDGFVLTSNPIQTLIPTSGTTQGSKLIPFNKKIKNRFLKGLNVWLFNSYLRCPAILTGQQYWSMSPITKASNAKSEKISVGFTEDSSYFGAVKKYFIQKLFATPVMLQKISDPIAHEYLTLLFMICAKDLSLISIWSPTFLIVKLEKLLFYYDQIIKDIAQGTISHKIKIDPVIRKLLFSKLKPNPKRAKELSAINISDKNNWQKIWPKLKIISCWTDGSSATFAYKLKGLFPKVKIEEKGLISTEGIVTIPWFTKQLKPVAYRSHFFEFQDIENKKIYPLWEIVRNKRYTVILTTDGGLYRYKLHDTVEVTDFIGRIPSLKFIGRETAIVDMVGEKVCEEHIQEIFNRLTHYDFIFKLVSPSIKEGKLAYTLFLEPKNYHNYNFAHLKQVFENEMRSNFYYLHAQNMSQLEPLRIFLINHGSGLTTYIKNHLSRGKKEGDIKYQLLTSDLSWDKIFKGQYV